MLLNYISIMYTFILKNGSEGSLYEHALWWSDNGRDER
jgi:hypothetical protein